MPHQAMDTPTDNDPTRSGHPEASGSQASSQELDSQEADGRDSGIVEVEGKASAVAGGVTSALANTLTSVTSDVIKAPVEQNRRSSAGSSEGHDIEIDTDLGGHSPKGHALESHAPRPQMITQTVPTGSAAAMAATDEDEILVADEEIESAEPARPTLTSGLPAFGRSLPPAPPSRTSLPPPRRSSRAGALQGSSLPPPSFPSHAPPSGTPRTPTSSRAPRGPGSERDPWILANKTLELSRAHARISVLEDQIAFRDARILSLEERLEAAQQKVEELERKLDAQTLGTPRTPLSSAGTPRSAVSAAGTPRSAGHVDPPVSNGARAAAQPAVMAGTVSAGTVSAGTVTGGTVSAGTVTGGTVTAGTVSAGTVTGGTVTGGTVTAGASAAAARPANKHSISIPKPADVARSTEANKPAETKSSPMAAAAPAAADADGPEVDGGSIPPEADDDLAAVAAPSGPEDVRRIAGIGPRFEAALRKQGVTRVSQIAAWSDADVRQMAKALKIPKSRIVKGRWVEAAREMIGSRATSE
jgi:predicted flap endonuclease-1-like 5' DNA nuclease